MEKIMTAVATAIREKIYTVEEYFELERHSTLRHEFVNGKLYTMPGESRIANRIATNCTLRLGFLEDRGYDIIRHDVRTIIRRGKHYRYPDLAIAKRSDDIDSHGVTKPELLIEVTSENSDKTDNSDKVTEYTALLSLQYYLIISQYEMSVKIYTRQEKGWHYDHLMGAEDIIDLPLLGCQLLLKDIYEEVELAENKSDS